MDLSVALVALASFFAGLLVTSRLVHWIDGILSLLKPPGQVNARPLAGPIIASVLFQSGPWLLAMVIVAVWRAAASPRVDYLWALAGGLALAVAFIAVQALRVIALQRKPNVAPPLTPVRFLLLRRRFFWLNSLLFAFGFPALLALQPAAGITRSPGFLVLAFAVGLAGGWMWSWFMWQWYGEALKAKEKARERRESKYAAPPLDK